MEKLLKDLEKLISIESVAKRSNDPTAPFGKGVKKALLSALETCYGYGMETKNCENMIGYAQIGEGDDIIGILVHLDVVPAGDGWDTNPFKMTVKDKKIFGRGAVDDKGPACAVIHALKELLEEDVKLKKRVRIIFGQNEENGDWDDMEYYKKTEEKISFGFTPDAQFPAIYAEKGIANLKFSFPIEKTRFKSIDGGTVINMVPDYCKALLKNDSSFEAFGLSAHGSTPWNGKNAISRLFDDMPDDGNCLLTRFFKELIKGETNGKSLGGFFSDEASGDISYNFGIITTKGDKIELLLDMRYPVTYKIDDIIKAIRLKMDNDEFNCVDIELVHNTHHVYMDKTGPLITTLTQTYREVTKDNAPPIAIGGGTYARAMDNIVAFGPMFPNKEGTEHRPNEYIGIDDLMAAKEIYKLAIKKLAVTN